MEPTDITVRILREIRDELKGQRKDFNSRFEKVDERFELIETTLVGTNEHLLTMSRALRALMNSRGQVENRLEEHEARLLRLEKRKPH